VTAETLKATIAETESAADLPEESRARLLSLYQRALSNLEAAAANKAAAQAFREAQQTAPAQVRVIRERLGASSGVEVTDPLPVDLAVDDKTPVAELETLVLEDRGELALTETRLAELSQQLDAAIARPAAIRQRLRAAEQEQTENLAQRQRVSASGEISAEAQARQWALETRAEALVAEIGMLNQELLSQPAQVELLEAKRDQAVRDAAVISQRLARLETLITQRRQADAGRAKVAAEAALQDAEGLHPLVVQLAEQNAALSVEIADTVTRLDEIRQRTESTNKRRQQLDGDFESAREVIAIGGANMKGELGNLLRQQRQALPNLRTFEREQARAREDLAGESGLKRVLHRRAQQRLADTDAHVAMLLAEAGVEPAPESMRSRLVELVNERRALLEKAIESEDLLLRRLSDLEAAQSDLAATIKRFRELLDVNLLWVRNASHTELAALGALPDEVWRIVSPSGWAGVVDVLVYQATHSAVFVLLGLVLVTILWGRKHLFRFIETISERLGKPTTDRFAYTLQVLWVTLVAAAAWPSLAAVVGWQLRVSPQATDYSVAVGGALVHLAFQFYFLRALRLICIPHGLAAAHFRWPEPSLRLLRREMDRLSWTFLPAAGALMVMVSLDLANAGWMAGRIVFVLLVVTLAVSFFRLLNPTSGVLAHATGGARRGRKQPFLYPFWYLLVGTALLALAVLDVMGYIYTAAILLGRFVQSAWMVVALILLTALAYRWVKVVRRRIAYEKAIQRRQAAVEARRSEAAKGASKGVAALPELGEVGEPEVDLDSLSDSTGGLIKTAVVTAGVVGLAMIWSDVVPALGVLDKVSLWQQTVMVGGEEQFKPITLADVGLALIIGVATFVFAKQIPALLEMILLSSTDMSVGERYTITTLTAYAIITIGLLVVFGLIGVPWSQLQWLVAALGLGIGFGLQEIVANFISGLIILFERPVRVGDVVTVGDTDGVVTKIQIRATTIRNWDRKELLVPNKEFVTGRLLNWSLSDQVNRVVIVVGVAYGSDVDKALALMREAAEAHAHVVKDPAPILSFEGFGDNSLTLILRAFLSSIDHRISTVSDLHKAINQKFAEAGIDIAFPQRDLHLNTSRPLQVEIHDRRGESGPVTPT